MAELKLQPSQIEGAKAIANWLGQIITEEGMDRPVFRTVAEYIKSDIEEAVA